MSSCPSSPWPHRAISSQWPLLGSETMATVSTTAWHIRSRSWPTVEVPAEDVGEEDPQIDLLIDSSTEVGLEFGDDGSVRLLLLSSGGGGDRRSSHLPKFGEWDENDGYTAIFQKVREERASLGRTMCVEPCAFRVTEKSKPLKRSQITKRIAKIIRLLSSIFKKKKHTDTLPRSVREEAANPLAPEQPKPPTKIVPRTTNIGLAHIFSYEELNQATNSFTHEIADGGFSRVYLGKLQDGRKVAVKVLYEGVPKRMEQFLNEVTVLSRLRHKNLVALYGCTDPETQKLLLVYEFVPNGTIADHLHGQLPSLTWDIRMQIAIETAEALSYIHSCKPPIIHRDVKTSNILLDDDNHAKVADLGMCRLVPWDTTSVSTLPQGTVGYRDPEYDELCKLTLKSDVYSFGVVLLELISGKPAVDVYREETEIYLFKMAVKKILNKELDQLVDLRLGYGSNSEISRMVSSVAALSCVCLQPKADPRPPMVDVLQILKGIRDGMRYA